MRSCAIARARVRSNEVGRNNAEEDGREGLPKTGKNDEGFEERWRKKEAVVSMQQNRTPFARLNEETEVENGQQLHRRTRSTLEDKTKDEISRFSCELNR